MTPTSGRDSERFFGIGMLRAVVYRGMGALLIVLAAVTWGTTGATMKLVAAGSPMSPLIVGFLRVAIAAPCLWLTARWLGGPIRIASRRDWTRLLVAGIAMGMYQPFYFWGVAMTSVAVGSLIGGFIGAGVGRKLPAPVLRGAIVLLGVYAIWRIVTLE